MFIGDVTQEKYWEDHPGETVPLMKPMFYGGPWKVYRGEVPVYSSDKPKWSKHAMVLESSDMILLLLEESIKMFFFSLFFLSFPLFVPVL